MNNLTTCTSPSGDDSVSQKCPAQTLAAVVPSDWKQFIEACAEVENCTVNISAIARRAKKLLGGADGGPMQPVAVPDGWKLVPIEPTDQMVLAPGAIHTAGKVARIHRDVWKRMLDTAPAAPAAQGNAETIRQAAFDEAIDACYKATASRVKVRKFGDSAHYVACVDAIRAIAAKRTGP